VVWIILSQRAKKVARQADARVEQNNAIIMAEDANKPLPGQVPMTLLSGEQNTLATAAATDATWSANTLGTTHGMGLEGTTTGPDTLTSTMTQDLNSGGGMTLDDDEDDESHKSKTIKISMPPPS